MLATLDLSVICGHGHNSNYPSEITGKEIRMSAEENKALARRVIEGMFNEGNLDLADEVFAPDYGGHDPAMPEDIHGPEGFKEFVSMYRSAFPDVHVQIEDQLA